MRTVSALLLCLIAAPATRAEDEYYVFIFGSQTVPKRARHTHTWATFVKNNVEDSQTGVSVVEEVTISWMPANGVVRPLALRAESGANLGMRDSIRSMLDSGQRVSMWGPFRIDAEMYDRAVAHQSRLQTGQYAYKAHDSRRPSPSVTNCMHAVCDALGIARTAVPETQVQGEAASAAIARTLRERGHAIESDVRRDSLLERLGLHEYPITKR